LRCFRPSKKAGSSNTATFQTDSISHYILDKNELGCSSLGIVDKEMFDWFFSLFSGPPIEVAPHPPPVEPKDLPYDAAGTLLHGQPDVPFYNKYWDYPLNGPGKHEIEYSERMRLIPLFSSKHQVVNGTCTGKLHFTKSLKPELLEVDRANNTVMLKPKHYVITADGPLQDKCASVGAGGAIPVNYRIGGAGPGGPEMSFQGPLSSSEYQKHGPHFLGRVLKDGSYCIEPSALSAKEKIPKFLNDGSYIIRTG
jgi:hypothetical protein